MQFENEQEQRVYEQHIQRQRRTSSNPLTKPGFAPSGTGVGKVHPVSELKASRRPTEWIVEEIGARGACVLLAADKGSGKTSLLYAMANAITNGEVFMGQLPTTQSKVLVLQGDESRTNACDKLEAMGFDADFDFLFPDEVGWNGLELPKLRRLIEDRSYGAVLLDSVTTLLGNGAQGVRMNDPEFAGPLYGLNQLAGEMGILAVIASHLRKTDGQTQRSICADDVLGAGTLTSAVSDVWSLTRARQRDYPDHFVLECLGKRNCQLGTAWNLQGSQEDFSWVLKSVVDPNDLLPEKRRELKARIVQLLTDATRGLTAQEIAAELGCNAEVARRSCRELALGQQVRKEKAKSNGGRPPWLYGIGLSLPNPH